MKRKYSLIVEEIEETGGSPNTTADPVADSNPPSVTTEHAQPGSSKSSTPKVTSKQAISSKEPNTNKKSMFSLSQTDKYLLTIDQESQRLDIARAKT